MSLKENLANTSDSELEHLNMNEKTQEILKLATENILTQIKLYVLLGLLVNQEKMAHQEKTALMDSLAYILKKSNNGIFCGQLTQLQQTSLQNQAVLNSQNQRIQKIQLSLKCGCQHLQKLLMDMLSELVRNQFLVMIHLKIGILSTQTQLKIMLMLWRKEKLRTTIVQLNLFIMLKKVTAGLTQAMSR